MKRILSSLIETVEIAFIAILCVLIIRTFLVQPFLVSGDSMEPTFKNGEYLLVDEISYRFRDIKRGEVVVFQYPGNESIYYIKRIIGLPGEKVVVRDNKITIFNSEYRNGFVLSENYLSPEGRTSGSVEIELDEDNYFVMGDNRLFSFDSRSWGSLEKDNILGLARFSLWPINSVKAITAPSY